MTEHGRATLLAALLEHDLPDTFVVRQYGAGVYVSDRDTDTDLLSASAYGARDWTIHGEGGLWYGEEYGTPDEVSARILPVLLGTAPIPF